MTLSPATTAAITPIRPYPTPQAASLVKPRAAALLVVLAVPDVVLVPVPDALSTPVPFVAVMTQISPVESDVMNRRPVESHARPTGRKQPLGQAVMLAFDMMGVQELVELLGAMGRPEVWNGTENSRYPLGGERFQLPWLVM